jgi:nucleoside-diphosphate-sugar epimerase
MQGCDTVFHVAGHLSDWDPYEVFYKSNVVGTRTMLTAARAAGVLTFVAVGASAVVMGRSISMKNISEDLPLQAPYIKTKAEAERLVRQANPSELRTVVIRPSLIWGRGDADARRDGRGGQQQTVRVAGCWAGKSCPPATSTTSWSACSWLPKKAEVERPIMCRTAKTARSRA